MGLRDWGVRVFGALGIVALTAIGSAQDIDISVSPTPVGSGARAAGMADSFVAVADDATAASWNPAGLVQLERPEISVVAEFLRVRDEFTADDEFDNDQTFTDSAGGLNFASITYPIPVLIAGRNAVVGLSYQQRYDLNRSFDVGLITSITTPIAIDSTLTVDYEQEGALGTITPAFAIEITDRLSIGASINFWRSSPFNDNGWDQTFEYNTETIIATTSGPPFVQTTSRTEEEEYEDLRGENITAGLLWNVNPRWNLALRYDSAFTGDIDYKSRIDGSNIVTPVVVDERREMSFPDSWTVGAAYRPYDKLTLALSITRTDWNDFYVETAAGEKISLIDGTGLDEPRHAKFDPTYTVRLGMEYVLIPDDLDANLDWLWSLRGGVFLDQEPASGRSKYDPNDKGDGDPEDFYGFALGVGLQAYNRVNVDVAYQLRHGDGVNSDRILGLPGFEQDFTQHRFLVSTIIYF